MSNQKPKTIQLPVSFLADTYSLVLKLHDYELPSDILNLVRSLEMQIQGKFEAMERRKVFGEYKAAAAGTDGREAARKKYLKLANIPENFQSKKEILIDNP
jgi:hypothetical protein